MRKCFIMTVAAAFLALFFPREASAQWIGISTNAVGWLDLGTINAEVNYSFARHFTAVVNARYNPWTFRAGDCATQFQNRKRSIAAGVRWWPWHVYSGWWVSATAQVMEYNRGGLIHRETMEGDSWGGVLTAGYTRMLSESWNLEFGLGAWAGCTRWTRYSCPTCGTLLGKGTKFFILPDDVKVSLVYVF